MPGMLEGMLADVFFGTIWEAVDGACRTPWRSPSRTATTRTRSSGIIMAPGIFDSTNLKGTSAASPAMIM